MHGKIDEDNVKNLIFKIALIYDCVYNWVLSWFIEFYLESRREIPLETIAGFFLINHMDLK